MSRRDYGQAFGRGRSTEQYRGTDRSRGSGRGRGTGFGRGGSTANRDGSLHVDSRLLAKLQEQESSNIVMTLANPNTKFKECIEGLRDGSTPEVLMLVLNVLAKAFSCNSLSNAIIQLVQIVTETRFFDTVTLHLFDLQSNFSGDKEGDLKQLMKDILTILWELALKNPSSIGTWSRTHAALGKLIDLLRLSSDLVDEDILTMYRELTKHKEQLEDKRTLKSEFQTHKDKELPPDEFRDIQIFPQKSDIQSDEKPFLRANKAKGGYNDLDHYLDVQFRLLREDFIGPLREGVHDYVHAVKDVSTSTKKFKDVRIYDNVRIIAPVCDGNGLSYILQFNVTNRLKRINWQSSKRLIFGSLVCLSSDHFNTFFFASVTAREVRALERGFFRVSFEHDRETVKTLLGGTYTMVETTAYFESYRHVLAGLQRIRPGDFPFEKYIVKCENEVATPAYLTTESEYDLRPLIDRNYILHAETRLQKMGHTEEGRTTHSFSVESEIASNIAVLDPASWPTSEMLHLDESQFRALQTALTKEFAIIQGPPGTGKTHIGMQIVKVLLHNKQIWYKYDETGDVDIRPMLIVCYTNHALDQFLEGVVNFFDGDVLRVGGRSNSKILQSRNLSGFRQELRRSRSTPIALHKAKLATKNTMEDLSKMINANSKEIEVYKTDVLHEDFLKQYIGLRLYINLIEGFEQLFEMRAVEWEYYGQRFSVLVEWLSLGNMSLPFEHSNQQLGENDVRHDTYNAEDEEAFINVEDVSDKIQNERRIDEDNETIGKFDANNTKKQKEEQMEYTNIRQASVALQLKDLDENPWDVRHGEWKTQGKRKKKIKRNIENQIAYPDIMGEDEAGMIEDIWRLNLADRWRLYRLWIQRVCNDRQKIIDSLEGAFAAAAGSYKETLMQEDKEIMRRSTVIGMTTTGAARYQAVLQEIRPRIIIVEEAAEVLEAHIITTLSKGCEHLILIGDHKQLQPSTTVYNLAIKYNLNVSLFERMIKNAMKFDCLELQHRMRPQIAGPLRHIYNNLRDHADVEKYENVKGVSTNMFFVSHNHDESQDDDLKSHSNQHEAEYAARLCWYLLLQGYKPQQITILTPYSGQLFCLKRLMPEERYRGVTITIVDNFQGEENDIIILSLVRSNADGHIGFLKKNNRVCVALSRAKIGFYVIGNFELFASKSDLWKDIVMDLKIHKLIGDGLKLYCQNHPDDDALIARTANDFSKAPEGGCSKTCDVRLQCGHVCEMFCHVKNVDHKAIRCRKPCGKIMCEMQHRCPKECFQDCDQCTVLILKKVPKCGHLQNIPCSVNPEGFKCVFEVEKAWSCGHSALVKCNETETVQCPNPCGAVLACEHVCEGTCGKCYNGRIHQQCTNKCKRILICGHECKAKCNNCPPCENICMNRCPHSRCIKYCGEPCVPCMEPCNWRCTHYKCSKLCSEPCDRQACNKPCKKMLPCKHPCIGLCGEPCPDDCRKCDQEKVTTIMFGKEDEPGARFVLLQECKHIVEYTSLDKYMELGEDDTIQLKSCPICRTPIRKSYRYGNTINKALGDIEIVKKTVKGDDHRIAELIKTLDETFFRTELKYLSLLALYRSRYLSIKEGSLLSEQRLVTLSNQYRLSCAVMDLLASWKYLRTRARHTDPSLKERSACDFLKHLLYRIKESESMLTEQEITDINREIIRGRLHLKLKQITDAITDLGKMDSAVEDVDRVEIMITSNETLTEEKEKAINVELAKLRKLANILGVSEDERVMIVKAIGLSKGHWFKCPNNHVYAIGECGGATETGKCPECRVDIGGSQHRLTDGNTVAAEMDGAKFAAYSEEANNMENFLLDLE